jgi:hypothetical protein
MVIMRLSIRAYARHRGVSHVAVKKAIDAGRISQEPDGKIDPEKADQDWAQNTLQPKAPVRKKVPVAAVQSVQQTVGGAATASGKSMTLLHAKTASEVVKAQLGKARLAQIKGELVDRSQAIAHVFALARAERDALLNWPAQIAADLAAELLAGGVTQHTVLVGIERRLRDYLINLGELRPKVD